MLGQRNYLLSRGFDCPSWTGQQVNDSIINRSTVGVDFTDLQLLQEDHPRKISQE